MELCSTDHEFSNVGLINTSIWDGHKKALNSDNVRNRVLRYKRYGDSSCYISSLFVNSSPSVDLIMTVANPDLSYDLDLNNLSWKGVAEGVRSKPMLAFDQSRRDSLKLDIFILVNCRVFLLLAHCMQFLKRWCRTSVTAFHNTNTTKFIRMRCLCSWSGC